MRTLYESILDVDNNIENTEPWKDPHEKVIYFFNELKSSLPQAYVMHTPSNSGKSSTFHINKCLEYKYNGKDIRISINYKLWYERGKLILDSPKFDLSEISNDISRPIYRNYIDLNANEKFINKKSWGSAKADHFYGHNSVKYELNIDLIEEFLKKFENFPNLFEKLCKDIMASDMIKNMDEFKQLAQYDKSKIFYKLMGKYSKLLS